MNKDFAATMLLASIEPALAYAQNKSAWSEKFSEPREDDGFILLLSYLY